MRLHLAEIIIKEIINNKLESTNGSKITVNMPELNDFIFLVMNN